MRVSGMVGRVLGTLAVVALFVAATGASPASVTNVVEASADEIFNGVVFGTGTVGQRVYQRSGITAGSPTAAQSALAERIPREFIERFGTEMRSGDAHRVSAMLDEATQRLWPTGNGKGVRGDGDVVWVQPPVCFVVVCESPIYLTQTAAKEQLLAESRLKREQLVAAIVTELR